MNNSVSNEVDFLPQESFFVFDNKTGVFYPDKQAIINSVIDIWRGTFGEDLSLRPESAIGTFMNIFYSIVYNCANNMAYMSNQNNVNYAEGFYLNLIGESKGLPRHQGSKASVWAVITGVPLLTVPAGLRVRTTVGDIFISAQQFTLDETGRATVLFTSEEIGFIFVAPHSLTNFIDRVEGLSTIDNLSEGIAGRGIETDGAYRERIIKSSYLTSNTTPKSIETYILDQNPEVISVKVVNNKTDNPIVIDSDLTIPIGAFWVGVFGGYPKSIARAIFLKSGGAVSVGTDSEVITDNNGVEYTIKFSFARPVLYDIMVEVSGSISNITDKINKAIYRYKNGISKTGKSIKIGEDVTGVSIAQILTLEIPNLTLDIHKVQIGIITSTDKEKAIRDDLDQQKKTILENEAIIPITPSIKKNIMIAASKAAMDKLAIENIETVASFSDIISMESLNDFKLSVLSILSNEEVIDDMEKILLALITEAEKTYGITYKLAAEKLANLTKNYIDLTQEESYKWLIVATHTFVPNDKINIKLNEIAYPSRVKVVVKNEEYS